MEVSIITRATHTACAIASALILSQTMDTPIIDTVCGALCTAMLPDIDQDVKYLRHRGQTHSFIWPMILYMISRCVVYGKYIVLGMAVGWLSHVIIDLFNGKGCESLWPLTDKNYRVADIKYNGIGERVIFVLTCVGIVILLVGVNNLQLVAKGVMK